MTAIAPHHCGVPAGETPPVPRKQRRLLPGNRKDTLPMTTLEIAKALVTCGKGASRTGPPTEERPAARLVTIAEARLQFAQQQPLGALVRVFSRRDFRVFCSVHTVDSSVLCIAVDHNRMMKTMASAVLGGISIADNAA